MLEIEYSLDLTTMIVVALHMFKDTKGGSQNTIVLSVYNASSPEEALGKAVIDHAKDPWTLGAYRCARMSGLLPGDPITQVELAPAIDCTRLSGHERVFVRRSGRFVRYRVQRFGLGSVEG